MAEEEKKKRKRASGEPEHTTAPQNLKAGEMLRQARIAKGLELEEISSAIHVRVGQLKAIEENHLEALPGMTYAVGFVKSYANYLKIDPVEITDKFKAENGAARAKPILQNHEPLTASKMPDPYIIGAAAACVVVILVAWAIFSGGDDHAREIANVIPPAPPIVETPSIGAQQPVAVAADTSGAPESIATGPLTGHITPVQNVATSQAASAVVMEPGSGTSVLPRQKPTASAEAAPQAAATTETATAEAAPSATTEINIKSGRGRVALKATQSSWVQVTDGNKNVVYKKVLRPGEVYYVPQGPGYSLVTSNAGGLDVYVDGARVKALGGQGDIVRGVRLQPEVLTRNRPKKSAFQE